MAVPAWVRSAGVTAADRDGAVPGVTLGGSPPCAAGCLGGAASPVAMSVPRVLAPARRARRPLPPCLGALPHVGTCAGRRAARSARL